ncbi:CinA family protein [Thiobacillus sp. 65-1402]|uniref:CinA family protein n=1 Tax=Thiobacillus sp. 65-1402 TaxID=1895861 RepID=UPI0009277414|nr:CinA family protein [Thiobacillus sp. 65-1402]OJW42520.1 MAG: damage-inducible protein CinA [Thiobacillus sp. 65-1059]OJW76499.1 MAG: damage-inducible protein CinA [Thiobacillus sp. 65-1402]
MARVSNEELQQLAAELGDRLRARGWMLATAESCTGGWVGQLLTALPGSSQWYERGFITYANAAKIEMLGVPTETLDQYGAVSEETASAMAAGALAHSHAQATLAISGIAGPGGGTPQKPVGLVCYGWALEDGTLMSSTCRLDGDREEIRSRAVAAALRGLIDLLE